MTSDATFSFLTSQDEYHCFLEKMLLRASTFYIGVVPDIRDTLIDNYIQMEKASLREDYIMASFYYIKQLEEIIVYGLNLTGLKNISNDLREKSDQGLKLSPLGDEKLNYKKDANSNTIKKILDGEEISLKDLIWTVKLGLFKHYFKCSPIPNYKIDDAVYYMRNKNAHGGFEIKADKENNFLEFSSDYLQLMTKLRANLKLWRDALSKPQNRK